MRFSRRAQSHTKYATQTAFYRRKILSDRMSKSIVKGKQTSHKISPI